MFCFYGDSFFGFALKVNCKFYICFLYVCTWLNVDNLRPKFPRYTLPFGYAFLRCVQSVYLGGRLLYMFKRLYSKYGFSFINTGLKMKHP